MRKELKKTIYLYFGSHWFHRRIAEYFDAVSYNVISTSKAPSAILKPIYLLWGALRLPNNYETYLCEDTYMFPAFKKRIRLLKKTARIINITAGSLAYYLVIHRINILLRPFYISFMKDVDGFICTSTLEEELVKKLFPNAITTIVYPYIKPEVMKKLLAERNSGLGSHKILMIAYGHSVYYKGLDLNVQTFLEVKKKWPDTELIIVGKWSKNVVERYEKEGVKFEGEVESLTSYIKTSALCIHLARGESFGISVIEAMLGGIPAIVSNVTGAKDAVERLDKNFVVPLDPLKAAELINIYFGMALSQKRNLSKRATNVAKRFTEKNSIKMLKMAYDKIYNLCSDNRE